MFFQRINIRQVPWEVLKTAAEGRGFQHLPRDLANVNAWKTMFDPYINHFSEKMTWQLMWIVCLVDETHEMTSLFSNLILAAIVIRTLRVYLERSHWYSQQCHYDR